MKITLDCPHAYYGGNMIILCRKTGQPCGHVFFKRCKGWWVLTPAAAHCPLRRDTPGED